MRGYWVFCAPPHSAPPPRTKEPGTPSPRTVPDSSDDGTNRCSVSRDRRGERREGRGGMDDRTFFRRPRQKADPRHDHELRVLCRIGRTLRVSRSRQQHASVGVGRSSCSTTRASALTTTCIVRPSASRPLGTRRSCRYTSSQMMAQVVHPLDSGSSGSRGRP